MVRKLTGEGRVQRDPTYHARDHHVRFDDLRTTLLNCQHVVPDSRMGPDGKRRHPKGYVAWGPAPSGGRYRVDFNLHRRDDGDWMLIVTGFEVE